MTYFNFQAPAELYLGSDWQTAAAQGPRTFRTAAQALRFALEEAAPVSLKGASLHIDGRRYTNIEMGWLYRSPDYPFARKTTRQHKRGRAAMARASVMQG